jgi:hypothetical protein
MPIYEFDSVEDLFAAMEADQKAADEAAKTHHLKVEDFKHGDYFASPRPDFGVVIFGEVWEYCEKYPEDNESIQEARQRGYLYGRCFSPICPEGEIGSTHITNVSAKVSAEVFERAKANGFRHLDPVD